jgi:hypothetical protein
MNNSFLSSRVYGKGHFVDVKGRKMYFDPLQHTREPEEDIPIPLVGISVLSQV